MALAVACLSFVHRAAGERDHFSKNRETTRIGERSGHLLVIGRF
jgi:hypothetical protein